MVVGNDDVHGLRHFSNPSLISAIVRNHKQVRVRRRCKQRERLQPLLIELLFRQSYAVLVANLVIPLPVAIDPKEWMR
ncbi:hypothetical protein D3C72_2365250 [compost metagenome]